MGVRWSAEQELAFWEAATRRPHKPMSAVELRETFAEHREAAARGSLDAIVAIRLVAVEIVAHRSRIGPNRRISPVGLLMAEIDNFFDAHRYTIFDWPSTWAHGAKVEEVERADTSPLSRAGYRAGKDGLPESERRSVLTNILAAKGDSGLFDPDGEVRWGSSNSALRLSSLAYLIAGLIRAAARRKRPPEAAIDHWTDDLGWLKVTYYDGRYGNWRWPVTPTAPLHTAPE